MSNPYLLLWLEAPLQSWGHDSRFGRRDSLDFPTRSGVLGLICCARGAGGEQRDWLAAWLNLDMQVIAYVPQDRNGRAVLRQPLLRDFQMVGSGYDDQDSWQTLLIPKTQEGKKAVGGGAKMTYRYYLQDMAYAVIMEAPASCVDEVVSALRMPVWDIYLGRKCCVPTEFIFQGCFDTAETAIVRAQAIAGDKRRVPAMKVLQGEHEGEVLTLYDVPVQLGVNKQYRDRRVTVQNGENEDG